MPNREKQNASGKGGAKFTKLAGGVNGQGKVFRCGVNHIAKLRREIQAQGLALRNTSGRTQVQTLLPILEYLGPRGANTKELEGLGFFRAATRVQDLEEAGWQIAVTRERLLGADGLVHINVARYRLVGRCVDYVDPQGSLNLGGLQ